VNLSFFTLQYQQLCEQLAVQSFLHSPCEITEPSQQEEHQVRTSRSTLVFDRTVALPVPGLVALQCSTVLHFTGNQAGLFVLTTGRQKQVLFLVWASSLD
jgi:hypothetical protein